MTDPSGDPGPGAVFAHATALVLGQHGILIRGASGSGKSSLAAMLCREGNRDGLFARLIGDDRVALTERGGRVIARPHAAIAGLVERRMLGLVRVPFEPAAVIRLVVDLVPQPGPPRYPAEDETTELCGVKLPRLALPSRSDVGSYGVVREMIAAC